MSQLRTFKFFTNAAPVAISTQQANLTNLDGYAAGVGWFQLFDLAVAPTTGVTAPTKSINVAGAGNLSSLLSSLGPIFFQNGIYAAMSSTEAVYTAVATNFDVWGEFEEWEFPLTEIPVSTAADVLNNDAAAVWSNVVGNSDNRLVRATVVNNEGATRYLMLFATNTVVTGDKPIEQWKILTGTTLDLRFGTSGIPVITQVLGNPGPGPAVSYGCYLFISTTPTTYTGSASNLCNFTNLTYR